MVVKLGHFRLGFRTLKTGLAVMICILLFHFLGRGSAMIAALSAVFALRQDISTTLTFGKSRLIGNTLGGFLAMFYYIIQSFFNHNAALEVILIPLFVMLIIIVSDGIDNNLGILGAISTLLVIVMTVPKDQSVAYAFERLLDTFIGTFIAFGVNIAFRPKQTEKIKEIDETILKLEEQEIELEQLRNELEQYRKPAKK